MALPDFDCGAVTDVCCDMLFNIASNIMESALEAVQGCAGDGPCGSNNLIGYVSVGLEVQDPIPDYLVVSLVNVALSPGSSDAGGKTIHKLFRAQFQVRLLESGWPQPHGDENTPGYPLPDEYMNAARHSYAHGEAMYRALLSATDLNPYCSRDCYTAFGPLLPIEPRGGAVGWQMTVATDYPMNSPKQTV